VVLESRQALAVDGVDGEALAVLFDDADDPVARAKLIATIRNSPGVLGQVCTIIGEAGGNIVQLRMHHRQADFFDVDIDVDVNDAKHLTHIAAALRANPSVETVDRRKD
jgi:guanosine-3',5'-bis(diphosphate) 3'-pyrophosphohydrolase